MFNKKKSPSIKIPNAVLKREASKVAKKMIAAEKKKERTKVLREKAKSSAVKKVQKKKANNEVWESYFDESIQREIWGWGWVFFGIILLGIFMGKTEVTIQITGMFQTIFGLGMWGVPFFFLLLGGVFLTKKDVIFHPTRIFFLVCFVVSILGLINLFLPENESHALSHKYGGAIGFVMGMPRMFLGDGVAALLLLALLWMSLVLGFGVKISAIFSLFKREEGDSFSEEKTTIKVENTTVKGALKEAKQKLSEQKNKGRFVNEVEIIDSTKREGKQVNAGKEIKLAEDPEAKMEDAKNKKFGEWSPPELDLLAKEKSSVVVDEKKLREKAEAIREKLEQFGIEVLMKSVHVGPTVTQFTLEPAAGVKLTKITALKSDLALALAAENVRIEAPIRGKKLVGIEIPNEKRAIVGMREILESDKWLEETSPLKIALGRDVSGRPIVADLAKMPHLLIAGKTGSGKSVAMNAFLISLLWNNSPENLRMILVDPKRVELAPYNHLPHLLTPVIVEPEKSVSALAWAVAEMNRRYKDFSQKRCRNIAEHNEKFPEEKEPYIVIVIDELADLMMVAGKDVEAAICRVAQMARAVGMHLIVATQRPSVDVVTGLIKANLPARIAFKVSSGIDSRTIIDGVGAEDLLGFGDMLNLDGNSGNLTRVQGLYVSTEEVERITNHIKLQFPEAIGSDEIKEEITSQSIEGMAKGGVLTAGMGNDVSDDDLDAKFNEAVEVILETRKASASFLQRRLEVGYARAARILDQMEAKGIIGPAKGAKAREIYGQQEQ